jgi:hypothetical protein
VAPHLLSRSGSLVVRLVPCRGMPPVRTTVLEEDFFWTVSEPFSPIFVRMAGGAS